MSNWKERFTYHEKHFVEREVAGRPMRFYPNRVALLHDLAEVSRPVARAMVSLMGDSRGDAGIVTERFREGGAEGEKTTVQPVSPEAAEQKRKERDCAIDDLLSVADARNRLMLGRLFMDSMREVFPYARERSPMEVEEFLDSLDLEIMSEVSRGWIAANARVFGDAGERLAAQVRERLDGLRGESPSESPSPTDGSSSRTPSSPPSAGGSPSSESSS